MGSFGKINHRGWAIGCCRAKVIHLDLVNNEPHITSMMPGSEIRVTNK